jgi:hypothetical protein
MLDVFGARVQLNSMDSRDFLREHFNKTSYKRPFFYLDAHWEVDIPLLEELTIILSTAAEFVIVIDDFMVPHDPGFGFDVYGSTIFDWSYISSTIETHQQELSVFYPTYSSSMETGAKRGFIAIMPSTLRSEVVGCIGQELMKELTLAERNVSVAK